MYNFNSKVSYDGKVCHFGRVFPLFDAYIYMVNLYANMLIQKNLTKLMIFSQLICQIQKFSLSLQDISTKSF